MAENRNLLKEEVKIAPPTPEQDSGLADVGASTRDKAVSDLDIDQNLAQPVLPFKDEVPSVLPGNDAQITLEPVIQSPYDLVYTCLLVPRFHSHYLMGDISNYLHDWMEQICISFGWRLEFLSVNPEYFQWVLRVPPATSTAYFMRVIRQQTSRYIFGEFPRFGRENISKDFWAPGYLISFGSQPHPVESVRSFIRQTRQQQGILPDG